MPEKIDVSTLVERTRSAPTGIETNLKRVAASIAAARTVLQARDELQAAAKRLQAEAASAIEAGNETAAIDYLEKLQANLAATAAKELEFEAATAEPTQFQHELTTAVQPCRRLAPVILAVARHWAELPLELRRSIQSCDPDISWS
jgi:hypothetical protein